MEELLTRDYSELARLIWEIVLDPARRPTEALLVFGILVGVLLLLMLVVLLIITRRPSGERVGLPHLSNGHPGKMPASRPTGGRRVGKRTRVSVGMVVAVAVAAWWVATAFMTSTTAACTSCHGQTDHALTQADADPHGSVTCVRCHDGGSVLVTYTTAVPRRVEHMVVGITQELPSSAYGRAEGSCVVCHRKDVAQTTTNEARAVKVSHAEPLEAGAACLDCHGPRDGVIGLATAGMQPCLRCHDDATAPAECTYCHTGDIALAVAARSVPTTATAEVLVREIDCGGCHEQESCDSCHGIRLPHTPDFMAYAHAREGVEDLWYNGGETCGKCHNDDSRPCTSCHGGAFLSHGIEFAARHSQGSSNGCDVCHSSMAYRNDRDFCGLCHAETQ